MNLGTSLRTGLLAAALVVGTTAAMTAPASARVVCNRAGDCWSTNARVNYPYGLGIRYYSDRYSDQAYRDRRWKNYKRNWRAEQRANDRGYYRDGIWITF